MHMGRKFVLLYYLSDPTCQETLGELGELIVSAYRLMSILNNAYQSTSYSQKKKEKKNKTALACCCFLSCAWEEFLV